VHDFAPKPIIKEGNYAPVSSYTRPGHSSRLSNTSGMTGSVSHAQLGNLPPLESIPPSLRPSSSMAQLDSYTPSYAPPKIQRETSPAPSEFYNQRRGSFPVSLVVLRSVVSTAELILRSCREKQPPPDQSANPQFYGPPITALPAQQYQDQARYNSHNPSPSVPYQHIPPASSNSTLRGSHYQGYDAALDDLTRPLSSMSMTARPSMAEFPPPPVDAQQYAYPAAPSPAYPLSQHGYVTPNIQNTSIDQFGRPVMQSSSHSYSVMSTSSHSANQLPAPTPPPPSNSAPPSGVYPVQQGHPHWAAAAPPPPPLTHPNALPSSTSQLIAPPTPMQRPSSPGSGSGSVPKRPLTASSYHALPQPPSSAPQQQQQQQHEYATYQHPPTAAPSDYGNPQQNSYGAPRPLPSTTPMSAGPTMVSSPYPASPSPSVQSISHYPPPPQTPSHYVSPPHVVQWSNVQQGPPSSSSSFSSYPPPPPGPVNGGYVYAGPQATSPSNHPGQYPPPPPVHQLDYSQQYYAQAPPPPSHLQQLPHQHTQSPQQQPPPPMQHYNHPPTPSQLYYQQQQPPY
jgi:hypothetical protein